MKSGTIVNSYYDNRGSSNAYVDMVITDGGSETQDTFTRVPILKMGGFSMSLPVVGSTGIIEFLNGNTSNPILVGWLDSDTTKGFIKDDKTPMKPPTTLTR